MDRTSRAATVGSVLFVGGESFGKERSEEGSDWRADVREGIARVTARTGRQDGPHEVLFVEAFCAEGADLAAVRSELRTALEPVFPVIAVTPVKELAGGRRVSIEAILVPTGERLAVGDPGDVPRALRIGPYFVAHTRGSHGETTTEKIRHGLSELSEAFAELGVNAGDVLKYNLYYVGSGTRDDWTEQALTRASLFGGPGPSTTGIPVTAFDVADEVIQLQMFGKAVSRRENDAAAVRPAGHWDWPVPLPYFHGNRVGELMLAGGQVSLAPDSQVLNVGDLRAQVLRSMEYIGTIFDELGGSLGDSVRFTAFYEAVRPEDAEVIRDAIREAMPETAHYDLSLLGFDKLAYPDMLVEIEAQGWRTRR